jgi:hypothetical protein
MRKPIDAKLVEKLARYGLADHEIADCIGVAESTLRARARAALAKGRAYLRLSLRRRQLRAAAKGSVPMLIWLGKQYLGQRDQPVSEQGDAAGPPRVIRIVERADDGYASGQA